MTTRNSSKINHLINEWPHSAVYACSYLEKQGISRDLIKSYRRTNWLKAVGRGAVARAGDKLDWTGGLYAIQKQLRLPIHIGAKTALEMQGSGHFVSTGKEHSVFLFGASGVKLPSWFRQYDWKVQVIYSMPNLFSAAFDFGVIELVHGSYSIRISSRERAIFEALHLVPQQQEFEEAKLLMDGLRTLRPKLVQNLLEQCNSIKVKRMFMYLAEMCNAPWVKKLDLKKVDFGKGKRVIAKGEVFSAKYGISVPKIREGGSET